MDKEENPQKLKRPAKTSAKKVSQKVDVTESQEVGKQEPHSTEQVPNEEKQTTSSKKLFRTSQGAIIAGVCAGLGQYFAVDPVIIRLLFVLTIFVGGFGIPIYIILWIVLPEQGEGEIASESTIQHNVEDIREKTHKLAQTVKASEVAERPQNIFAFILILLGVIFMLDNFGWVRFDVFWPLILIIIGFYLLAKKS